MKLVIQTQYKENYGAHDWNGEGECPQYWKFKGGDTYVMPGVNNKDLVPALAALIEYHNEGSEEYILSTEIMEDDAQVCEEWETPWVLVETDIGFYAEQFRARDYTWSEAHPDVIGMRSSKVMKAGEADDYEPVLYVYEDGETKTYDQFIGEAA